MDVAEETQKVIECGERGAAIDLSEPVVQDDQQNSGSNGDSGSLSPEEFKEQGNTRLKAGDAEGAVQSYTRAIEMDPTAHIYFANRSAAYAALESWAKASSDASQCIALNRTYVKGHFRLAAAQLGLGAPRKALAACREGLRVDPGNKDLLRLAHKAKAEASRPQPKVNLYKDLIEETQASKMLRKLKENLREGNSQQRDFEGMFSKLLDKNEFQKMLFPGLSKEQRAFAPQTFEALLEDPRYSGELEGLVPRARERAEQVLANVKAKGAARGDAMGPEVEARLWPQVLEEAFAREVPPMVNRVHRAQRARAAAAAGSPAAAGGPGAAGAAAAGADPADARGGWGQLEPAALDDLRARGVAVQDEFLGEEWLPLLVEDTKRLVATGQLTPVPVPERAKEGVYGDIAFVEPSQLEEGFPALAELVKNLHALPFELQRNSVSQTPLASPLPGSTAIIEMRNGCSQPKRLDCGEGADFTGYFYTCIYFFSSSAVAGGDPVSSHKKLTEEDGKESTRIDGGSLILQHNVEACKGSEQKFEPENDRLVIFQSQANMNGREELVMPGNNDRLYSVTFWIHGVTTQEKKQPAQTAAQEVKMSNQSNNG